MKKAIIIVTSVVLALLVALGVFIYWCFGTREFISHDIEKYETLIKHFDFLPSLEDLGEYEDVYYKYFERQLGALFESHAYTLRVVYNEDEFIKQKNIIEENYSFRETVKDLRGDDLVERKTSFTIALKNITLTYVRVYTLSVVFYVVFSGIGLLKLTIWKRPYWTVPMSILNTSISPFCHPPYIPSFL